MDSALNFDVTEDDLFYDTIVKRLDSQTLIKNYDSISTLKQILARVLKLEGMDEFRKEIIFDYNIYNLRFCQEKNFSAEQVSTYMSIINFILVNSLKRKLSQNDSYEILEKLVSRHAHQCPPYAEYFFTDKEKVAILKHVRNLYKYYLMYEICLTKFTDYNIISVAPFTGLIPDMDQKEGSAYNLEEVDADTPFGMYLAGLNEDPVEGLQDGEGQNDVTQSVIDNEMLTNMEATEAARKNDASGSQSREITAKPKGRKSQTDHLIDDPYKDETPDMRMGRLIMEQKFGAMMSGFNDQLKKMDDDLEEIAEDLINPKKKKGK